MKRDVTRPPGAGLRKWRGARTVAALFLVFLIFLGLSFAAVAQMTGRCEISTDCIAIEQGNCLEVEHGSRLLSGTVSQHCEVRLWDYIRFDVSDWSEAMLRRLGVRFNYGPRMAGE